MPTRRFGVFRKQRLEKRIGMELRELSGGRLRAAADSKSIDNAPQFQADAVGRCDSGQRANLCKAIFHSARDPKESFGQLGGEVKVAGFLKSTTDEPNVLGAEPVEELDSRAGDAREVTLGRVQIDDEARILALEHPVDRRAFRRHDGAARRVIETHECHEAVAVDAPASGVNRPH